MSAIKTRGTIIYPSNSNDCHIWAMESGTFPYCPWTYNKSITCSVLTLLDYCSKNGCGNLLISGYPQQLSRKPANVVAVFIFNIFRGKKLTGCHESGRHPQNGSAIKFPPCQISANRRRQITSWPPLGKNRRMPSHTPPITSRMSITLPGSQKSCIHKYFWQWEAPR